jgi:hypothetical protein
MEIDDEYPAAKEELIMRSVHGKTPARSLYRRKSSLIALYTTIIVLLYSVMTAVLSSSWTPVCQLSTRFFGICT